MPSLVQSHLKWVLSIRDGEKGDERESMEMSWQPVPSRLTQLVSRHNDDTIEPPRMEHFARQK